MGTTASTLVGGGLALAVAAGLFMSDAALFEDAPMSPLYKSTLDKAYDRFREDDARVPAGHGAAPRAAPPEAAAQPGLDVAGLQAQLARGHGGHGQYHDHNGPRFQKGNELAAAGRHEEALAEFREALKEHHNCTLANHRIADILKATGRFEEAIAVYGQVLATEPNYTCVYEHLGDIFVSQGQPETAEKMFQQAISGYTRQIGQGGPGAVGARFALARFYVEHDREIPQALALAEAASGEAPQESAYLDLLARCYQLTGRIPEAVATVDRIIALKPEHADHYRAFREQLLAPPKAPGDAPAPAEETTPQTPR